MSTRTTCFRVYAQTSDGVWTYLFDADFAHAIAEVRKFKARGIRAKFEGEGGQSAQTSAKRRARKDEADRRIEARLRKR